MWLPFPLGQAVAAPGATQRRVRSFHKTLCYEPSFGQVFVTAKVKSGVMIQATLG